MLYLLDRDVRTVRWNGLPLHEASSAIVKEELNGDHFLVAKYPISDSGIYRQIREDMLIKAPTPDLGPQLFRIKKPVEHDGHVELTAYHITEDIMQRSVEPLGVKQTGCAMALSQLVQRVKTPLGDFSLNSDIFDRHTFNTTETETLYSVLMDGKHSIVGTWEGELVRDNFALSVKKARGADRGVIITTHNNLESYQRTRNSQGVVTRIHAKATFRPEGAEVDTVLQVTVDSPLINQYPYINEKEYENNEAKTVEDLRKWAEAKFKHEKIDQASDAIEIAAVEMDGQTVHLGDTVTIKSRKHGVDLTKKAIAYEFDCLANGGKGTYMSLTFDDKPGAGGSGVSSGVSAAAEAILEAAQTAEDRAIDKAIANANAAFDAEFDKAKQAIEDGIEEAKAAAEVVKAEIGAEVEAVAREGQAVKRTVEAGLSEADRKAKAFESDVRSRVGQIEIKANQVADQARQSDQKADQALTRAGASEKLAQTAKDTADRAIRQAGDNLRTAQERANQLQVDLDTAKRSITSQARDILNQAQAQSELTTRLQTAETTANGTKTAVTELTKTVNANTGNLTSVTQRVATAENTLTNVRNQYSTLKMAVDDQSGKVTSLERQTADLSSGLDGVKERFESIQIGAVNLFRLNPATKGYFKGTRNNDVVGSRYAYGPKISVEGGGRYLLQIWAKQANDFSWIGYNQLDADGNHIAGSYSGTYPVKTGTYFKKVITTLPNAKYIQFSFSDDVFGDDPNLKIQLEKGTIPTDYQPAEEDFRHEFAEYKRTATENTSRLEQSIQTADGKAEGAKTLAQQTAQGLALKAEKSTLDSVTGRVSSAEGTIRLQAEQIAQRLTSTQVDSAITAKGYQTKAQVDANITGRGYITNAALAGYVPTTTFDNYKTETAQAIERGLTATRALIPSKVGVVNLVPNSKINESSNVYGFATRQVNLEAGKSYWFGARAKKTGGTAGKSTRVYLVKQGWSEYTTLDFSKTEYEVKWIKHVPKASGMFDIRSYWFPGGGDRTGTADVDWYMVAESDLEPTTWSPAPEDMVTSVDFNRIKETAELYERVIGRSEGDIQTNVARQVLTSQLYQTEVTKANWDSRNHIRNGSFVANGTHWNDNTANSGVSVNYDHSKAVDNRRRSGVHIWGTPSSRFKGLYQLFSLKATTGQKVTLSALVSRDGNGPGNMEWGLHFRRGGAIVNQTWKYITPGEVKQGSYERQVWTVSLPVDVDEINVMFYLESGKASNYYLTEISFAVSDRFVGYAESLEDTEALTTRVSQLADSYGVKVLGNKEKILSELNLNSNGVRIAGKLIHLDGTVTASDAFFKSVLADKIEAGNIKAGAVTTAKIAAGAVTADHLLVNQAMIDKLVTNSVWADRLFAQAAFVNKLKAVEIQAGQIRAGLINTDMLAANAVTADKLLVNQALFNKLMADEAYLRQLFAKQAFITQVQSVVLSADKITSGTIDARRISVINLDANQIKSGTIDARLVRVSNIDASQITSGSIDASRISAGILTATNRNMAINLNRGQITFSSYSSDIIGSEIHITDHVERSGWIINNSTKTIRTKAISDRTISTVEAGDFKIWESSVYGGSVSKMLQSIINCLGAIKDVNYNLADSNLRAVFNREVPAMRKEKRGF